MHRRYVFYQGRVREVKEEKLSELSQKKILLLHPVPGSSLISAAEPEECEELTCDELVIHLQELEREDLYTSHVQMLQQRKREVESVNQKKTPRKKAKKKELSEEIKNLPPETLSFLIGE